MIADIAPERVSVGYDNYGNGIVEPSLQKTVDLIEVLDALTEVNIKAPLRAKLTLAMNAQLGIEDEPECVQTKLAV